jgi:hypothetical protein
MPKVLCGDPIFLVDLSYSGDTPIHAVLASVPDLVMIPDTHFFEASAGTAGGRVDPDQGELLISTISK